jgi:hypothetical protein
MPRLQRVHPARPAGGSRALALQASALRLEPSLLRVPQPALHANLVWLLPVHQEFDRPKGELWQRRGPRWIATLADAAGRTSSFHLSYCRLVATKSAVITVADEPNRLSALRRELMPLREVLLTGRSTIDHKTVIAAGVSRW